MKFGDFWRVSAAYGTAFRAPNFMDLYYCDSYGCSNNSNLKPEESKNIEASMRYQDNLSKFSATIFQNKIKNFDSAVQLWGTKWNAGDPVVNLSNIENGEIDYIFDTAWCYPHEWLLLVSKLYFNLDFIQILQ